MDEVIKETVTQEEVQQDEVVKPRTYLSRIQDAKDSTEAAKYIFMISCKLQTAEIKSISELIEYLDKEIKPISNNTIPIIHKCSIFCNTFMHLPSL